MNFLTVYAKCVAECKCVICRVCENCKISTINQQKRSTRTCCRDVLDMPGSVKRAPNALQLTLAILKPDVIANPMTRADVQSLILQHNFLVVRSQQLRLSRARAEEFYGEHKGKFFYNRLVNYMCCGPISAHVLARQDAIVMWRTLMGPTKVFKALHQAPYSIRGRFGLTDTRNCTHGSDSEVSSKREIGFFFPDFDTDEWYKSQENYFRTGKLAFNTESFEHYATVCENED